MIKGITNSSYLQTANTLYLKATLQTHHSTFILNIPTTNSDGNNSNNTYNNNKIKIQYCLSTDLQSLICLIN